MTNGRSFRQALNASSLQRKCARHTRSSARRCHRFILKCCEAAFNASDYNLVVLPNDNKKSVDVGLKYVNNDACYPSLMVVGQVMEALLSGKYDLNHTAVLMSQTGGGCRASNYVGFIRRALKKAGMEQIPVISINLSGLEV